MSGPRPPFFPVESLAPFPGGPERPVRSRAPWVTGLVVLAWTTAIGTAVGALGGLSFGLVLFTPAVVVLGVVLGATAGLVLGVLVGFVVAVLTALAGSSRASAP